MTSTSHSVNTSGPFAASLFDGETALEHRVQVTCDGETLFLRPIDERAAAPDCPLKWKLGDILEVDGAGPNSALFSLEAAPDARLRVEDPVLAELIQASIDPLPPPPSKVKYRRTLALSVGACLFGLYILFFEMNFVAGLAAKALPYGTGGVYSERLVSRLSKTFPACEHQAGVAPLTELSNKLAAANDLPPPRLHVLKWPIVNAFALPGGHVILTKGFIENAKHPGEIAGVLAHEMAHVVHRDPLQGWLRSETISFLLSAIFGSSNWLGAGETLANSLLNASYTRSQEARADRTAVEMLTQLNLSSEGSGRFFQRMAEREKKMPKLLRDVQSVLSTHPGSAERAELFRGSSTGTTPPFSAAEWNEIKHACE